LGDLREKCEVVRFTHAPAEGTIAEVDLTSDASSGSGTENASLVTVTG
jgi:hypothetical protein